MTHLPLWGIKLALRLAGLPAGAYHLVFIVEPDGTRKLIVPPPRPLEVLGGTNSHSDSNGHKATAIPQVE